MSSVNVLQLESKMMSFSWFSELIFYCHKIVNLELLCPFVHHLSSFEKFPFCSGKDPQNMKIMIDLHVNASHLTMRLTKIRPNVFNFRFRLAVIPQLAAWWQCRSKFALQVSASLARALMFVSLQADVFMGVQMVLSGIP